MDTHYDILDFKATIKHAYYGCSDPEALHCDETGRSFPNWTAAARGWIDRYLEPILNNGTPRNVIVAHDMGRAYRTALYPEYKANRAKRETSPIETAQLDSLMNWAKSILSSIGATQIGVEGVEADDVIAWICENVKYSKAVYTVDADLLQLCSDSTAVYLKNEPHFGAGEKDGVPYHLTSLVKSIVGDTSDNYPGIKGLGPAKIEKLIEEYGVDGLEELQTIVSTGDSAALQEVIDETGDKILQKLMDNFGDWRTMWRLANLNPTLCWKPKGKKLTVPTIHKRIPNGQRTHDLLSKVFSEDLWESVFESSAPVHLAITSDNWEEYREDLLAEMAAGDIVAFDYETTDKDPITEFHKASASGSDFVDVLSHELTGASFCFGAHSENVIYLPVDHRDSPNLPKSVIAELLEHSGKVAQRVAQNASFEGTVSQTNLNMELRNVHDTKLMKRYVDENTESGLKFMSKTYLSYDQASYKETLEAAGASRMDELTLEQVFSYGADDAQVTAALYDLLKLLLQLDGQWEFYCQWAVEPTVVLQHSYINGVKMNWTLQKKLHDRDIKQVEESTADLRAILKENVTGEITEGCKSLIEAEKKFVHRSAKKKFESKEVADEKLYEWRKKLEASCQYLPYREELIMPRFAVTAKQLTAASEAVGLPPITKVSNKGIGDYLAEQGAVGFTPSLPEDPKQREFLEAIIEASDSSVFSIKAEENKLKKAEEAGDETKAKLIQSTINRAEQAIEQLKEVVQRLAGVEPKLVTSGDELNVGSPVQMQQLLYCKIGVPVRLKGKNVGKNRLALGIREAGPSTDETAIETAIANDVEPDSWQLAALRALLKVKSARTRISLYHEKYPLWLHRDGKVHPSITDAGTDTRRPTGSSPNILQVSKKDKEMRSIYMPPEKDWVCVAIDYSGQELRLMACETGDPVMIDAYNNPEGEKDLHSVTGSGIAALKAKKSSNEGLNTLSGFPKFDEARSLDDHPLNKLATAIRKSAKGVNFGLGYGAAAPTLSRNLIVPLEEAEELLGGAMALYARIPEWQQETATFMNRNGFTLTAFGTKRHATDDLFSSDRGKVSRQHRQGTNATIQGTAAEMLRIVLTLMVKRNLLNRLRMHFFAPIYDEVVSFVHKDDVLEYCKEMDEIMRLATPPGHIVPQIPEFSIGPDWGRVHELGRWPGEQPILDVVERSLEEAEEIWEEAA